MTHAPGSTTGSPLSRRSGAARRGLWHSGREKERERSTSPTGTPYTTEFDLGRAGLIGASLAVGLLVGASLALLLAPESGVRTRTRLRRGLRHAGRRTREQWEDWGDVVRFARG